MSKENIREIAVDTVVEILEHGQFSHLYLKQVLDKYAYFEKNERSFITRLVNGAVERKIELDFIIDSVSKTKTKKMKPFIRTLLRLGVYEIFYMDAVPDSATCNEYVKLAKKRGFAGLSGFVNGVLRNVARNKGNIVIDDISIQYSIPTWIMKKWEKEFGNDQAKNIAKGFFENEQLCVRANLTKISRDDLVQKISLAGIDVDIDENMPGTLYLSGFDSVVSIPGFNEGLFYIQDYSSQLVCEWAKIQKTDNILDVCAAPGGKAIHAAELALEGHVEARDLTEIKVALIQDNINRVQATNIVAKQWDATAFDDKSVNKFDVVIADLPCSGLGIIRKKPDIKYNQTEDALCELENLQRQILDIVCQYVKHDGTLVYSTCTINKNENENQVKSFLDSHDEYSVIKEEQLFPTKEHDGFYICVMKRK